MILVREQLEPVYGYTVDEVARFLQYDREAVRYWLRTGHMNGQRDRRDGDWRVSPADLVSFLRQSTGPMPTGVGAESRSTVAGAMEAAAG